MANERFGELRDWEIKNKTKSINDDRRFRRNDAYYEKFFDFESMGPNEMWNFLYSESRPSNRKGKLTYSDIGRILVEEIGMLGIKPSEVKEFLNAARKEGLLKEPFKNFFVSLVKHCLYSALENDVPIDTEYEWTDKAYEDFLGEQTEGHLFYRGQSNAKWSITPSLARGLVVKDPKGDPRDMVCLTRGSLFHLYGENGYPRSLLNKYNELHEDNPVSGPKDVDYRFLSWMQHAVAYSPLIDFTKDYWVALSFALNAKNPNEFLDTDASLYIYRLPAEVEIIDREEFDKITPNIDIRVKNSPIIPGTKCKGFNPYTKDKPKADYSTYQNILNRLVPSIKVITDKANDRMARQKGLFVLLYDYDIVAGHSLNYLDNAAGITKVNIGRNMKKEWLRRLHEEHPEADLPFLMNPYLDFED